MELVGDGALLRFLPLPILPLPLPLPGSPGTGGTMVDDDELEDSEIDWALPCLPLPLLLPLPLSPPWLWACPCTAEGAAEEADEICG